MPNPSTHSNDTPSGRYCIFGATGGIGEALCAAILNRDPYASIFAGSRSGTAVGSNSIPFRFDLEDEASIEATALQLGKDGPFDMVIVATGLLQDDDTSPEKTFRAIDGAQMARIMAINTIGPALIAKHFLPLLRKDRRSIFAALSARVGSISDNRLGGWHSYRASKAALNMLMRNFAIELARINKSAIAVALHPGTVDTALSEPFQGNVPRDKLFTPQFSAERLLAVLDSLQPQDSGGHFAWDGKPIPA